MPRASTPRLAPGFTLPTRRTFILPGSEPITDARHLLDQTNEYVVRALNSSYPASIQPTNPHLTWFVGVPVEWDDFKSRLATQFIPNDYAGKLKVAFANLAIDGKKPLSEFNDRFRLLRLKICIVTKSPGDDDHDPNILDCYLTKLENAASLEKGSGPMSRVYGGLTQWEVTRSDTEGSPTLTKVMLFCAKLDDIHNRKSFLSVGSSNQNSTPLTTTQGGDAMDIYVMQTRGGYRKEKDKRKSENSNPSGKSRGRSGDSEKDKEWVASQTCFFCKKLGHLKKDCYEWKKEKSRKSDGKKSDARITEVDSSESEEEAKDEGDA
ncbi:hypothetical protein DFH27DRAFT_610730 [Peziza echinospora]|nr:hypothetical protein DFH27DRAFT_610730 [Peziza echinospora]